LQPDTVRQEAHAHGGAAALRVDISRVAAWTLSWFMLPAQKATSGFAVGVSIPV
jgi:hypothetical protein